MVRPDERPCGVETHPRLETQRAATQVVLVHDSCGVAVGDVVLVTQPDHALLEAHQARSAIETVQPMGYFLSGHRGYPLDQCLMGLRRVVNGHARLLGLSAGRAISGTCPSG